MVKKLTFTIEPSKLEWVGNQVEELSREFRDFISALEADENVNKNLKD